MSQDAELEPLLRHSYGRLVGVLSRRLGAARLDLAEDLAQEAMLRAVKAWRWQGVPDNPTAWLIRTGQNLAVDAMRRARLDPEAVADPDVWGGPPARDFRHLGDGDEEIADAALRMVFTCCYPSLSPSSRVALTLKIACGLGVGEIAAALLAKPATVAQRISRAKAQLQALPGGRDDLVLQDAPARVREVQHVLYLLFNEGYHASTGQELVRRDLVREAVRLGRMLASHPLGDRPETHALLALFLLQGARLEGRDDPVAGLTLLASQDRARWDRRWLAAGFAHLERAAAGDAMSRFHAEAGIAAVHAAAPSYDATDWPRLLAWYDVLTSLDESPIAAVNRAVVVAKVRGLRQGLAALRAAAADARLDAYAPRWCAEAMLAWHAGERARAGAAFERAANLEIAGPQRRFLTAMFERFEAGEAPPRI